MFVIKFLLRFVLALFLLAVTILAGCAGYVLALRSYWDAQVEKMCENDGGTKIFEVANLPNQQYSLLLDNFGQLVIPVDSPKALDVPLFRKEERIYIREGNPSVRRSEMVIIRRSDQKILGSQVTYSRVGGDLPSPAHTSSFSCPPPEKRPNLFSAVVRLGEK